MKKTIIAAIALTFAGYTNANPLNVPDTNVVKTDVIAAVSDTNVVADNEDKRTPVKLEELPDAVKKSLAGDAYMGWTPTAAFWVESKMPHYEIELSKGDDKSTARFDKAGQLVK